MTTRVAISMPKPVANPVNAVAIDHRPMPAALTVRVPSLSTIMPIGTRQTT